MQLEDDFVISVVETVSHTIKLTKAQREKIDAELRQCWAGAPVYVRQKSPTMRQAIREAEGTYDEIAERFRVSRTTVWRVRRGR